MKSYVGFRFTQGTTVLVCEDTTCEAMPLQHHVKHSPTGFEWGYNGSGPADLARCILIDYLDTDHITNGLYQEFKARVIAGLKNEYWTITGNDIDTFLKSPAALSIHEWIEDVSGPPDSYDVSEIKEWYEDLEDRNIRLKSRYH